MIRHTQRVAKHHKILLTSCANYRKDASLCILRTIHWLMQTDVASVDVIRDFFKHGRSHAASVLLPATRIADQYNSAVLRIVRGEVSDKRSDVLPRVTSVLQYLCCTCLAGDAVVRIRNILCCTILHDTLEHEPKFSKRLVGADFAIEYFGLEGLLRVIRLTYCLHQYWLDHFAVVCYGVVQCERVQRRDFQSVAIRHPGQAYTTPSFLTGALDLGRWFAVDLNSQRFRQVETVDVIDEALGM